MTTNHNQPTNKPNLSLFNVWSEMERQVGRGKKYGKVDE